MSGVGGTIGRHRRPSTAQAYTPKPLGERLFGRTDEEDENAEDATAQGHGGENGARGDAPKEEDMSGEDKEFKPVYLKGLFR